MEHVGVDAQVPVEDVLFNVESMIGGVVEANTDGSALGKEGVDVSVGVGGVNKAHEIRRLVANTSASHNSGVSGPASVERRGGLFVTGLGRTVINVLSVLVVESINGEVISLASHHHMKIDSLQFVCIILVNEGTLPHG